MLRSILNRSPEVTLAGETHFFDDLRPRMQGKSLRGMTGEEREACADYFRAQRVRPYGMRADPEQSDLSREILLTTAEALGDNVDAVFEAYCRVWAEENHARIWGEKTPRHIFRIDDIFQAFPKARVVCMVRDPRAVVASYRDWEYQGGLPADGNPDYQAAIAEDYKRKHASYHIVIATLMWRAAANAAFSAQEKHSAERVRIVRYEDVVDAPAETARDVAEWIGIEFDQKMLNVPLHNSSATRFEAAAGVSKAPNQRWQKVLSDSEIGIIQKIARTPMQRAKYEFAPGRASLTALLSAYGTVPLAVIRAARANRSRYSSLPKYMLRRIKAAMH